MLWSHSTLPRLVLASGLNYRFRNEIRISSFEIRHFVLLEHLRNRPKATESEKLLKKLTGKRCPQADFRLQNQNIHVFLFGP